MPGKMTREMLKNHTDLISSEIAEGTGAGIALATRPDGFRTGLDIWFSDLERNRGPVVELRPKGLKSHQVELRFGNFARPIIEQISEAPDEDIELARSLIESIKAEAKVAIPGQTMDGWLVSDGRFRMHATLRHAESSDNPEAMIATCREVIVPMMAAMAELIGYDVMVVEVDDDDNLEGAITKREITRRERNPRNRLLCLRIHGHTCKSCGLTPSSLYGTAGSIIEVHHLQPLSSLGEPRKYDPRTDLAPLCPNCHRAVHTRKPTPYSILEIQSLMGEHVD